VKSYIGFFSLPVVFVKNRGQAKNRPSNCFA
jgi:hypothetical protein